MRSHHTKADTNPMWNMTGRNPYRGKTHRRDGHATWSDGASRGWSDGSTSHWNAKGIGQKPEGQVGSLQASREHSPTRTLSLGPPASRTPGVFFFLAPSSSSRVPYVMVSLHPHLGWVWNHLGDTLVGASEGVFRERKQRRETHSERGSTGPWAGIWGSTERGKTLQHSRAPCFLVFPDVRNPQLQTLPPWPCLPCLSYHDGLLN